MTTVMICDDDPIVREALAGYMAHERDLSVISTVMSAEEALSRFEDQAPDVVLMDLGLPGMDGIEATRRIRERHPATTVLVLTSFALEHQVHEALAAGASGFLLKSTTALALVAAVRAAATGAGTVIAQDLAARIVATAEDRLDPPPASVQHAVEALNLTEREMEVLTLLCTAESNAGIAQALSLSESTIKTYVSSLMEKLGCASRMQIVLRAFERRLVHPPPPVPPEAPFE